MVAALNAIILLGALFVCCETVSVSLVASVSSTDVLSTFCSDVLSVRLALVSSEAVSVWFSLAWFASLSDLLSLGVSLMLSDIELAD